MAKVVQPTRPGWAKKVAFASAIFITLGMTAAVMAYRLALGRAYIRFSLAEAPAMAAPDASDAKRIARGEHLIQVIGCQGCHGVNLRGGVVEELDGHYRIVAPDLLASQKSDALAFEQYWQALRLGLDEDKRALWAMPRTALLQLANDDVLCLSEALMARRRALRAQAQSPTLHPRGFVGGRGYLDLLRKTLVLVDDAVPAAPAGGWPDSPPKEGSSAALAYEKGLRYRALASQRP